MSRLSSSVSVGGSTSALLRSANSLRNSITAYQDSLEAFKYANSAYTDEAFNSYQDYLKGRINELNNAGGVTNAEKALTLTKTLEAATKNNISSTIQRENIAVLSGNASLSDKYGVVVSQYLRAANNGDMTLAQSLMGQAYSLNQQIQYQAQAARDAAKALQTAQATQQGDIVTNLRDSLNYFEGIAKNASEKELNTALKGFVNDNADTFKALGVNVSTQQPNYFDVAAGIVGAIYNHTVLQAQAQAPLNPLQSRDLAMSAQNILSGATKFNTLGGSLSFQDIQQASQDPSMFAYDSSTGTYKPTSATGYQYMTFTDANGKPYQALVQTHSGLVGNAATGQGAPKVDFLSPNETKLAQKLGFNFTQDRLNADKSVGAGVQVQLTEGSPQWLKNILGENGVTNLYTDQKGDVIFKGSASSGQGSSYYTLMQDGRGLAGLFEHTIDGTTRLAGGDYGFDAGAAQLLINQAQQVEQKISIQKQFEAAQLQSQLKVAPPPVASPLQVSQPAPTPHISVPRISAPQITQATANPQPQTYNPQPSYNPQSAGVSLQGSNFNLNQSGSGGIRLGSL